MEYPKDMYGPGEAGSLAQFRTARLPRRYTFERLIFSFQFESGELLRVYESLCAKGVRMRMDVSLPVQQFCLEMRTNAGLRLIPEFAYCGLTG
jgi:hypothetical protein